MAVWPLVARGQQAGTTLVGYLYVGSESDAGRSVAVRKGLSEAGYVEGRNLMFEPRFAQNEPARLPALVSDLIGRRAAIIIAGDLPSATAAKAATTTLPIVFETAADPVRASLVASLNRPGANITGVTNMAVELGAKRIGILRELLPSAERFAALANPDNPIIAEAFIQDARSAAAAVGRQLEVRNARTIREIDEVFAEIAQTRVAALLIMPDNLFTNRRVQFATQAVHHNLPVMYYDRTYVEVGGLMSYGSNILDAYRQAGLYAGRILKGEKTGDLPVMQPTKFEFVINLQTAKTLGLQVPDTLLALADEVIE